MTQKRSSATHYKGILSRDSGATDPILIIAGIAITLILLVGGTFAVSGFINNAKDLNAKADLDRVATAQTAAMAATDTYRPSAAGPRIMEGKLDASLATGGIGFVPSDGTTVVVAVGETGWAALAESSSGASFLRTSESNATIKVDAADIREDFLITALEGRLVNSNGAAASLNADAQVVKFPSDVSVYNLSWSWVDAVWGLPADSRPAPGAPNPANPPTPGDGTPGGGTPGDGETPGGGTTNPPVEPEPTEPPPVVVPPFPTESALADRLKNPFSSTNLDNVTMGVPTQGYAGDTCVYANFVGRGATGWSVDLDPSSVLFNYDLDASHYTVGQFMKIERVGDRMVISAQNATGYMSKLDAGKKYQTQVCNRQVPVLPTALVDHTAPTTNTTAQWEKKVSVTTTSPYYLSWKIRIDFTDVVEKFGMQPNAFRYANPGSGSGKVTATHLGNNIYEFVGSGSGVDIKTGKPANFVVYPQ